MEYNGCDGALWYIDNKQKNGKLFQEVESTIYKYSNKNFKPDDLGFKYHALTFRTDKSDAGVISAYIGDVGQFINNHVSAGYNGLLVKSKAVPKKTIKEMFRRILTNWQFDEKEIRSIVKQV